MKNIVIPITAFLVAACAANPRGYKNTDQMADRLVGMSSIELVSKLGTPWDTVQYGEGAKSMSFRHETRGLTGGKCHITVVVHYRTVQTATVSAEGRSWMSSPKGACLAFMQALE